MTSCNREINRVETTYELMLDYNEIKNIMIANGFTFLSSSCYQNPVMDIIIRDVDCAETFEKKALFSDTDKIVFRFKALADLVSVTPQDSPLCNTAEDHPCNYVFGKVSMGSCTSVSVKSC